MRRLILKDRQNEAHGCFVCSFYGGCVPWNGQHGADGFGGCGCPRGVGDTLIYICTCGAYFRIFSSCGKKLSSLSLRKACADNGCAFHRRQFGSDNISPIKSRRSHSNDSKNAFCPTACITGSVAGTIIFSMVEGLKRGAFSNEAGLGSTVAVHSSSRIKSPELQGTWAMAEVL